VKPSATDAGSVRRRQDVLKEMIDHLESHDSIRITNKDGVFIEILNSEGAFGDGSELLWIDSANNGYHESVAALEHAVETLGGIDNIDRFELADI
jgi:hypothetical protein